MYFVLKIILRIGDTTMYKNKILMQKESESDI
jgi:hypothetical protein